MRLPPPQKFLLLSDNLARGAYPSPDSMRWLKEQGFRNLIYVGVGFPGRVEARLAKEMALSFTHVPIPVLNKPGGDYFDSSALECAFKILKENVSSGKAVYFFDDDGCSAVGLITSLIRKEQSWPAASILEEFDWQSQNTGDGLMLSSLKTQIFNTI
jgi:hypothetical protein